MAREKRVLSPDVPLMTTTLWDYRSQNYRGGAGRGRQGDPGFVGATPSYLIWNLLERYTREKWLCIDPMCGSGTTIDVARDMNRRALGYDVQPTRDDIFRADARSLPLENAKADFVFIDPPYSTHVKYSGLPECVGELDARKGNDYYRSMEKVIAEAHRVLKPERHMALYVSDSGKKGFALEPIGFKLFAILSQFFLCEEIVAVVRHNATLKRQNWHGAAAEGNFYLRGFNYLFIMYKPKEIKPRKARTGGQAEGRSRSSRAKAGARGSAKSSQRKTSSRSSRRPASTSTPATRKGAVRKGASKKAASGKTASKRRTPRKKPTRGGGRR